MMPSEEDEAKEVEVVNKPTDSSDDEEELVDLEDAATAVVKKKESSSKKTTKKKASKQTGGGHQRQGHHHKGGGGGGGDKNNVEEEGKQEGGDEEEERVREQWKKYTEYHVRVEPAQDDRATEIRLLSLARPHMRAFHCSWWSFFVAFFVWFAITPLLGEIRDDLRLTNEQIWTSSIMGVAGTTLMRILLGPLCDLYGARILFGIILCVASVPTAATGFVQTSVGLSVLRFCIGIAGGSFVMNQYWSTRMFADEVVGTANSLVAGWGNLGGGVTQIVMGSALFPLFKIFFGGNSELAWRTVCIVPAVIAFATGLIVPRISDDAPKGNYRELKERGMFGGQTSLTSSLVSGARNGNTWFLFFQYASCFGVELTMNNAAALYFRDEFGQSTESAAAIASVFGWMNLFARGAGGFTSDWASGKLGMRGRLMVQTGFLALEGVLILIFANSHTLPGSITVMAFFSLFVQAAEGSTYGIVPYVDPANTGSIAGIVGAGGNLGAVGFAFGFRQLDYEDAFVIMGATILCASVLSGFISIKGHQTLY